MALNSMSARATTKSPVPRGGRRRRAGVLELDGADVAVLAQEPGGPDPVADSDAVGLGQLLLVGGGAHVLGPAAVGDGDVLGAQALGLDRDVDGGVAAADHHDVAADRQRALSSAWRRAAM